MIGFRRIVTINFLEGFVMFLENKGTDAILNHKRWKGGVGRVLSWLNILIGLWVFISIILTASKYIELNLLAKTEQLEVFKVQCINTNGNIRHERAILATSVYCMKANGDEIVFSYNLANPQEHFLPQFTDRFTFGVFDVTGRMGLK